MSWYAERDGGVTLQILVQPRASRPGVGPVQGDRLKVRVSAPPVDGAANQAVIEQLAKTFAIARRQVTIQHGERGRRKTVRLDGVTIADVQNKLTE